MQVEPWARSLSVRPRCRVDVGAFGCADEVDDDEDIAELDAELTEISNCKNSARCSVGRRKALLDSHGAGSLPDVLTNSGRRTSARPRCTPSASRTSAGAGRTSAACTGWATMAGPTPMSRETI